MRCINKKRRNAKKIKLIFLTLFFVCAGIFAFILTKDDASVYSYEIEKYQGVLYQDSLKIDNLCVANEDVSYEKFSTNDTFHSSALFQINEKAVLYSDKIHDKLYPASTTKILTAYLALKYGSLTDTVIISENAVDVPLDSSKAGLKVGDQLTLEALLYGLMLPSGNDSAVAIAEHISGSEKEFVALMNEEAKKLGATNSNFINPHGYQDENHYTTAYDLYLIFNECVKNETFLKVVSSSSYQVDILQKNSTYRNVTWKQSNQFINGNREIPQGVTVIGGKTGTTNEAGSCLVLYSKATNDSPYISIIMGADTKAILYDNMTALIGTIQNSK